jgi:hypothetical protein
MVRGALAVVLCCAAMPAASANERSESQGTDGYLGRLAAAVRARLDDAAAAHRTRLVPPVPVAVKWKPQKLGSLDLGAPIAAVAAADLDGDRRAELYVVTAREVIAVSVAGKVHELARVAFTGDPAVPASRDVVGTAIVDERKRVAGGGDPGGSADGAGVLPRGVEGGGLVAAVSAWAKDMRVQWDGKALTGKPGAGGFRVCGERLQLAIGRNHFRDGSAALFGARCRGDLVDPAGAPLRVRAELSVSGVLDVAVERCAGDGNACMPAGTYRYKDIGVAFEIADVERDGTPDVVVSSASAPGDADAIRVIPLGAPANKPAFKKSFNGGVAGIVVADGDGDGAAEVIAVVRLAGATRVDVWRLV